MEINYRNNIIYDRIQTFYVTDRPTDNVTTVVQGFHPLLAHMHEDSHVTCQMLC